MAVPRTLPYALAPMTRFPRVSAGGVGFLALCLWPSAASGLGLVTAPFQEPTDEPFPPGDPRAGRTEGPELVLTLQDAVLIALENNLNLEIEEISTDVASFDATGSWGAFDPTFSTTAGYNETDIQGTSQLSGGQVIENNSVTFDSSVSVPFTTGGTLDLSYSRSNDRTSNTFAAFDTSTTDVLTLALTQPLLRGAWRRYATTAQRQSELDYERQREREREVRQGMIRDVYNAYWDLVSANEELIVRSEAVELAEEQLRQDDKRLEVGTGTEVDVLQSETNLAQQREQKINAEFLMLQAEDDLRRLLFQKPAGDVDEFLSEWDWPIRPLTPLPEASEEMAFDWRRSLQRAIQLRPELWQRRLEIDLAEVGLDLARTNRLAQLDATVSTTSVGFDSDPDEALETAYGWDFPDYRASLTYSIPIFNRSANYAERSARASVRQARLTYDRWEIDILAEVRTAVRDVIFRIESVRAAAESARLAEAQLKAEQARQEIGLSTTFEVTQFQQTLAEAQSDLVLDRAAYAKSLASLAFAEGRLEVDPNDFRGAIQESAGREDEE